ncbi:MAG: sigma-70 family RNA polymerase sigma factor [Devosia sp.]|nr:sigma-70 family RNA polymerase sigma factor [Devosia sp.]
MSTADATADILERHIPALRRYAFALTRDHDTADDLVQDCLERALTRWRLRQQEAEVLPWLFAILRNLYIDLYRRRQRRGVHTTIDEAIGIGHSVDQDSALDARDALAALDQLPEEQKSLLLLIGVEDLSYQDVARVLGVPIGTVMSRLSRARQRLRVILETGRHAVLRRVK